MTCNGFLQSVIDNTECTVPLSVLTSAPYNLLKGYSVNIKVVAVNDYGESDSSLVGNGAIVVLVPDAPILLTDLPEITSRTQIGIAWQAGASNGGSEVLDYRLSYDQSSGSWVTLEEALIDLTYTTSFTISVGKTYSFKIEARNSVGYSAYSSVLQILAADKPGQPGTPTTVS